MDWRSCKKGNLSKCRDCFIWARKMSSHGHHGKKKTCRFLKLGNGHIWKLHYCGEVKFVSRQKSSHINSQHSYAEEPERLGVRPNQLFGMRRKITKSGCRLEYGDDEKSTRPFSKQLQQKLRMPSCVCCGWGQGQVSQDPCSICNNKIAGLAPHHRQQISTMLRARGGLPSRRPRQRCRDCGAYVEPALRRLHYLICDRFDYDVY